MKRFRSLKENIMKKVKLCLSLLACVITAQMLTTSSVHAQWGVVKGKFVLDGDVPAAEKIVPNKDVAVCGKKQLFQEELVVSADGEIANVAIWLYVKGGDAKPPVHASYRLAARRKVVLDNDGCRFDPHVAVLTTGQPLELKNSDPVVHNTAINFFANTPINPTLPIGAALAYKFDMGERLPSPVACSIHPWMKGYLLLLDHPYAKVSSATGEFEIKNVPAGVWNFRVWQEKAGYVSDVSIDGVKTEWKKGIVQVDVKEGETTDLGTVAISAELFK